MASPESFHPVEAEPKYYHEELHAELPDGRDYGVDQWYHRKDHLEDFDAPELEAVVSELQSLPEIESYDDEKVTIADTRTIIEQARDFASLEAEAGFEKGMAPLASLVEQLPSMVDHYADTVRRFIALSGQRFRLETDKYQEMMKNVDSARRAAHNSLMSHLNAMSRFMAQKIPTLGGADFNRLGWEQHLKEHWFSADELRDRKFVEEWAIRADIAEKAQALLAALNETLQEKNNG